MFRGSGVECVQADVIIQLSVSKFKTSVTEDCQDIRLYKWTDILYIQSESYRDEELCCVVTGLNLHGEYSSVNNVLTVP